MSQAWGSRWCGGVRNTCRRDRWVGRGSWLVGAQCEQGMGYGNLGWQATGTKLCEVCRGVLWGAGGSPGVRWS